VTEQAAYEPPRTAPTGGYGDQDRPRGPRAGFWRRLGAALIDGLITAIVVGILSAALRGAGYALGIVLSIAYFVYFEGGASGQTLGKRALGIRVIDAETGGPIGYGRAFIRWVGRILSTIPIYLGYLWMLWDREKQTWHDKLAGDVVVPTSAYPVGR
jgi:uncharacterized RDD family membrane protein YckC